VTKKGFTRKAFLCLLFLLNYLFIGPALAGKHGPIVANVTGEGFAISWISDMAGIGKVNIYQNKKFIGNYVDDRGTSYKSYTHHVTIGRLKPLTSYSFSVMNGHVIDDNKGAYYKISTGPHLIGVDSVQPAGRIFLKDGRTIARDVLIYVTIEAEGKRSGLLSTYVDKNGYWFLEAANARTNDGNGLFKTPSDKAGITIQAISQKGNAKLQGKLMDNKGGKNLYGPLLLK